MANEFKIKNGLYVSGSATITNNITVSGSLNIVGGITGSLSGSAISASHALDSDTLGGLPSSSFAPAATFNDVSSSYASASGSLSTRVTDLESTASVLTSASASFAAQSASLSTRVTNLEATGSKLTTASASFAVVSSSYASASGSLSTRVTNLESTSSTVSSSFASTSGSIAGRVTLIEGQYATTGSNTFTKRQYISDVSNAIGFTSTASLYTDGGLRVTKDFYVSGNAYFNNVTVYGTSSIQYITSSQIAIGANLITLNTNTPSVRFGGISVFDSGSNNQSTGSLFWDSEKDRWVYSNPSGSTYDGGMLISGPRNTSGLGNEVGTTACAVMIGQGGDHITSSGIFSYANATCFYGNTVITGSGAVCSTMMNAGCIGVGTTTPSDKLDIDTGVGAVTKGLTIGDYAGGGVSRIKLQYNTSTGVSYLTTTYNPGGGDTNTLVFQTAGNNDRLSISRDGAATFASTVAVNGSNLTVQPTTATTYALSVMQNTGGYLRVGRDTSTGVLYGTAYAGLVILSGAYPLLVGTNDNVRLTIASTGAACFACELTAKSLGTNDLILNNLNYECANYVDGTRGSWLIQEGACDLFIINQVSGKKYKFNLIEIK